MSYFAKKLKETLQAKGLSKYRLHKLMGVSESLVVNVTNGVRPPTDGFIEKLSAVPELGLNEATLKAWHVIDFATPEILRQALDEWEQDKAREAILESAEADVANAKGAQAKADKKAQLTQLKDQL